ncbi:MAG: hypothetical protein JSV86_07300 [Gemmatimonadota bacterium]|nr:MAG: hypothetical protein JSV86_07300 [Gemmatimonadota bacterium]
MTTHFIIKTAAAAMPSSCWGTYRRVAVLEVEDDGAGSPITPAMISTRARGVVRVVAVWERCSVGQNAPHGRCAYSRALREAQRLVEALEARPAPEEASR